MELEDLGEGFFQVIGHFGFTESPDVPALLEALGASGLHGRAHGRRASIWAGRR